MTSNEITVVIPAHNEEAPLPDTLRSVLAQTVQPSRVLVTSDNSTDGTVSIAREFGVEVMETLGNVARKAGAINQALEKIERKGFVLVMDADTILTETWIESALAEMKPGVGGVGAVFRAGPPQRVIETLQLLEWARYAEEIGRTGKTFVLSGTAALIRWEALESVREGFGRWYDEQTITEDSRMSIDLKLAGWSLRSPLTCSTVTETMPTWKMLWLQRRRWYLGALQNVADTGFNRVTLPYWRQQLFLGLSVLLMAAYLLLSGVAIGLFGVQVPAPIWLVVTGIFIVERVATVWDQPLRRRLLAGILVPELLYALVLQSAYVGALVQKLTGSRGVWAHVERKEDVRK